MNSELLPAAQFGKGKKIFLDHYLIASIFSAAASFSFVSGTGIESMNRYFGAAFQYLFLKSVQVFFV